MYQITLGGTKMKKRSQNDNQVISNGGPVEYRDKEIDYDGMRWKLDGFVVGKNGSISDLTRELGFRVRTDQIGLFLQEHGYSFKTPFNKVAREESKEQKAQQLLEQQEQELLKQIEKDLHSQDVENDSLFERSYSEGAKRSKCISYYERNPKLRVKALQYHGTICKVCEFDFMKTYGKHGENYIEVHHLTPLHTLKSEALIDYKKDMTVLCSNCHRMVHRDQNNILKPEELKKMLEKK